MTIYLKRTFWQWLIRQPRKPAPKLGELLRNIQPTETPLMKLLSQEKSEMIINELREKSVLRKYVTKKEEA
jgi:hypothetical protein